MSNQEPEISEELIAAHGLNSDEYGQILRLLNREPTFTELGIFSAMWNEHCSYKSSKKWLRTLPTEGPQVICGPGENAGVVEEINSILTEIESTPNDTKLRVDVAKLLLKANDPEQARSSSFLSASSGISMVLSRFRTAFMLSSLLFSLQSLCAHELRLALLGME